MSGTHPSHDLNDLPFLKGKEDYCLRQLYTYRHSFLFLLGWPFVAFLRTETYVPNPIKRQHGNNKITKPVVLRLCISYYFQVCTTV